MADPEWNFGHVAGVCDVAYVGSGDDARLVTCGADNAVYVRHPSSGEVEESFTEEHEDMVNVVAVAPDGKTFATGSDDACVKLFAFEDGKRAFESNVTRFSLPVRALAFSADGAFLAAGGEDACVKVIKMADRSVALTLQTASKCVKSVSFDPKGEFLSATDDVGRLTVWALAATPAAADISETAAEQSEDKAAVEPGDCVMSATVAPVTAPDAPSTNGARWRPDGEVLAAPGRENDVTFFERRGWTELDDRRLNVPPASDGTSSDDESARAKIAHADAVAFVAWSPNGKYLLSSGKDCLVAVWDVAARTVVRQTRHDAVVCAAAWRAGANAVALVDANGQWAEWTAVVPDGMTSPFAPVGAEELDMAGGAPRDGREAEEDAARAAAADDADDADDDLADMDEEAYYAEMDRRRAEKRRAADAARVAAAAAAAAAAGSPGVPTPQPPFQVGAARAAAKAKTSAERPASRRFLCYNMLGSVTSTGEAGSDFNVVEMAFHDTSRRGRVPTITDYHGYDVAVLGERGCALASPGSEEGGAATVFYRPYESWAHAPEWRVALPKGERAVSIAAGDAFVAVVTSERLLRVFTHAGAQRHVVALEGAPVTCAGKGDSLVVVWHAAAPTLAAKPPGSRASASDRVEQRLAFAEYDVADDGAVLSRGALPLAPGSTLTWLGFAEDATRSGAAGAIAFASSDGVVRVRTPAFGGSFAPVFRSADARAQEGEHHWPVAVSVADDVVGARAGFYAVCCRDADGPPVHPKPVLTPMPLSHPVALPEGSTGELEDAASRARVAVALAAAAAEKERARRGGAVSGESADALREAHAASDKASLRLFHAACKAEKPARAADVAATLHLPSSMHGALKLANALGQGALAQRVTSLIEAAMATAAAEAAAAREPAYYEHPSQLETPGQDGGAVSVSRAAAAPAPAARAADDDANPFARRKPSAEKAEPAKENDASAGDEAAAGGVLKSKAGFERDVSAAPPAKKSRASNPFARK